MVNTSMLSINRSDCSQTVTDLSTWFGLDPVSASNGGISDPQVYFDPDTSRFFASALHLIVSGGTRVGTGIRLAVSNVDDPTTWTAYKVGSDTQTDFFDQPKLGVTVGAAPNANGWVMLSWNDFASANLAFNGATLTALDKSAVTSAAAGASLTGTSVGPSTSLFSIVPTRQSVPDADAFAAYNLEGVNFMGLIRWDGSTFAAAGLPITPTSLPPDAPQPPGGTAITNACTGPCIDTGDDRVESAVWGQNDALWTGLTEACDPGGGVRSCLRLDQFQVTDAAVQTGQDGDVGVPGWDLYYPAVDMDSSGNVVAGFNVSNVFNFPSTAITGQLRNGAGGNFAGVRILHQSTAPYIGQRWGDYSGAAIDPAQPGTVWVSAEETTSGTQGNWTTTLAPVSLGSSNSTVPGTISSQNLEQIGCCAFPGSGPAVSSWQPGRLDVFIRGGDNGVWHKSATGGVWSGWEALGGGTLDNPAAVSWGLGRVDVFARGGDNQLWHQFYEGGWSGWEPLGGALTSAPTVTTWGPGRLDIFVRGGDNQLWHKSYAGGWSGWEPLGGLLTSAPAAVAWSAGRIDLVVRSSNNGLWHMFYAGGWSGWEGLGGAAAGDVAVSSWGAGRLDIWVQGPTDNALYHKWWSGGWSLWTNLAQTLGGTPGAVSFPAGGQAQLPERVDVFWPDASGALTHMWAGV